MGPGLIPIEVHDAGPPAALRPCPYRFPGLAGAPSEGPVAFGGDFAPGTIVAAIRQGIFPWPHPEEDLLWFAPDPRAILPLGALHISRRLARTIRQGRFRVTINAAFEAVLAGCAERTEGTWITPAYRRAYVRLHQVGWAHSVEVWNAEDRLAGGLYGVAAGGLFGAESMFHRDRDASKIALVALVQHCRAVGISLIDIQVLTPHTASMGALEIPRADYLARLREVRDEEVRFSSPLEA